MNLPGGLWLAGTLHREFAFRPVTGALELAIAEANETAANLPAKVSEVLSLALATVGGFAADRPAVASLAVGDRQFLMRQLSARMGVDLVWLSAQCAGCDERFDFSVQQSVLPCNEAAAGFPFVTVATSRGPLEVRVPNGADQEVIAQLDDEAARQALLVRCAGLESDPGRFNRLTDEDWLRVESALESVAPAPVLAAQAPCPVCGADNTVELDPYWCLSLAQGEVFEEIHILASHYHWREADILAMPRHRRKRYLRLIDRARGMAE
ncbi:MAG: hypothetical protein SVU69_11780 [Pseudomonadota bacterium]|nr:hypothetical protein [Pseudomonadota bacterium]